ncbi:MAG: dihydrofolate reductase [Clostridia bacterium]|nr:dihydrofolate reductase [Clostridia bacterium]
MLSIIVAIANNNVIGKDNTLIWHLPEDLKRFKKLTTGHTIIMGRKTFESLGRILPNRKHIVLSTNKEYTIDNENVEVVYNISDLEKYQNDLEEHFVIGGAKIYSLLMPFVEKMYITKINENFEGDVYFPNINKNEWKEVFKEKGKRDEKNDFDYEYINYERLK